LICFKRVHFFFVRLPYINDGNADRIVDLLLNYNIQGEAEPNFNFIPVPSSLDVARNLTPLVAADYERSYGMGNRPTGNRTIPFDNFITGFATQASENEVHISFNQRNGDWLAEELDRNPDVPVFDCTDFCRNEIVINGNDEICEGENNTYSLSTNNGTVLWRIIEGRTLATITTNGRDAVLTPTNSANGRIVLEATLSDNVCLGGGQIFFTKTIWVGTPILDMNIECTYTDDFGDCYNICKDYDFAIDNSITVNVLGGLDPFRLDWDWEATTNNFRFLTDRNTIYLQPNQTGFIGMRVRAKNRCGTSDWFPIQVYVQDCGRGRNNFKVYPNPTTYKLDISLSEDGTIPSSDSPTQVKLYDMLGQLKKETILDKEMNGTLLSK